MEITRREIIHSDRPGAGPYVVGLDPRGKAITCSCIHGRSGRRGVCYHRKRAEKALAFRRARRAYLLAGIFPDAAAFTAYFHQVAEKAGVDAAIDRAIRKAPALCTRCGGIGHVHLQDGEKGECFRCKGKCLEP